MRRQRDFSRAKGARWLLLAGAVWAALWLTQGFEIAMFSLMACATAAVYLIQKTTFFAGRQIATANGDEAAARIEAGLLRTLTQEISPAIHFRSRGPSLAAEMKSSGLIPGRLHSVRESGCLTGVHAQDAAFCAAYVEAEDHIPYKDAQGRMTTRTDSTFRGLFIVAELAAPDDGLESRLSAFQSAYPEFPLVFKVQPGTLAAALKLRSSPFTLKNNEANWRAELDRFRATVRMISDLLEVVKPSRSLSERTGA